MIFGVLLLGFILRLISLNQSLWLDEATSALVAKMPWGDVFTKFLPNDFHPPLYYLILKVWSTLFGYSEVALRFPSVIFGVLTIYTVYLIGKQLVNQKTGLLASLLLATSGLHIYYSQEARMYGLATLLVTLSIYFFISKRWVLFSVILALIGLTDYISLFIIPVFLMVGYKDWKKVFLSFTPLLLSYLIWSPTFIKQLSGGLILKGSHWWNILGLPTFKNIALIPVKFILGRIGLDDKTFYGLTASLLVMFFGYCLYKAISKSKLLWWWLLLPIFLVIVISFKIPSLAYFRLLFCLPALYLLVASGIKNKVFIFVLLVINIISSGIYLFNPRFHREDWRSAASVLQEEKIIFPSNSQREALVYYGKDSQVVSINQLNVGDREIWLSRYVWEIFDPNDSTRKSLEKLGYNKASENNFRGVVFWKYTK